MRLRRMLHREPAAEPVEERRARTAGHQSALPINYVNWEHAYNYFGGTQSVVSELVESWRKRRSRRT